MAARRIAHSGGGVSGVYRNRLAQVQRAGIPSRFHAHGGDTRLPIPGEDGAVDRRRASAATKKREC